MTFLDKAVSIVLLIISLTFLALQGFCTAEEAKQVNITVDGKLYGRYDFSEKEKTLVIDTEFGENTVKIDKNSVWVEEASCRDKLDVKVGKINKTGQMIVCLPNRLMIEISGNREKVDKVTY